MRGVNRKRGIEGCYIILGVLVILNFMFIVMRVIILRITCNQPLKGYPRTNLKQKIRPG